MLAEDAKACGWRLGFELPPRRTVSQWADEERIIARGTGPEPGRWRTDRLPLLREPMDSVHDANVDVSVWMCSSQAAKTEGLINIAGYYIDQDPAPQMFVLPTLELADSFSTKRFTPTIEETPVLFNKVGRSASRDSSTTIREKSYPGGDIVFSGANSPASLASRPRRVVLMDEIDKYAASIGHDGDPIDQAFQRTQNFWNRVRVLASTPTLHGLSAIESWFQRSDQRHFHVPCHKCGATQPLFWWSGDDDDRKENVRWVKGKPESARYHCIHCDAPWDQRQLALAGRDGTWIPHNPKPTRIRGYHWNSLYSPWVSLLDLAVAWEAAEGIPEREQTFVNLKLGLAYKQTKGAQTTVQALFDRKESYGPDPASGAYAGSFMVPEKVVLVTVFVDVQGDRFEVQYIGWGPNDEKWVLDYRVFYGDPTDPAAWRTLDERLLRLTFAHPLGSEIEIAAIGIDAGNWQQVVMNFVNEQRALFRPFYAVKGVPGFGRPLFNESSEKFKLGAKLHLSGIDDGKTMAFQELARRPDPKTGEGGYRVHFPRHLEMHYFEMLLSERVKVEYKAGRSVPRWIKVKPRNEALDTFVGCIAVRHSPHCKGIDMQVLLDQLRGQRPKELSGGDLAALFKR